MAMADGFHCRLQGPRTEICVLLPISFQNEATPTRAPEGGGSAFPMICACHACLLGNPLFERAAYPKYSRCALGMVIAREIDRA